MNQEAEKPELEALPIKPGQVRRCPHCGVPNQMREAGHSELLTVAVDPLWTRHRELLLDGKRDGLHLIFAMCSVCREPVVTLIARSGGVDSEEQAVLVWPRVAYRAPVPAGVPDGVRADYEEAALVLPVSPKASAAMSRRCLQNLLIEKENVPDGDSLAQQVEAVMGRYPAYISENIDAIRNFGNFSTHPIKATETAQIIEVDDHEAEWLLEIIEQLLAYYYVEPELSRRKREALNRKLKGAGKPPMKQPPRGPGE